MTESNPHEGYFKDRVMLIAGAGPGMGRALALQSSRAGAHVVLVARTAETIEQTARLINEGGGSCLCVAGDASEPHVVKSAVQQTLARFGRLDSVVHSLLPPHFFKRVLDIDDDDLDAWQNSVNTSIFGAFLVGLTSAKIMAEQEGGSIVYVTATSALQGFPSVSAHAVGKAGIHSLAQCLASELGEYGVRVNSVAVGVIDGATSRASSFDDLPAQIQADIRRAVDARDGSLKRNVSEEEVTNTVLFLASDAASGITGQIVAVDGGRFFH